ncbi:MAG: hypothetical protein DRP91_09505 [Candidatus Neomarinimicrobiota bacterium]|nr:MAG: hypothetical protein DRP91_09505 [Candidatus Neomarinimicrobiota bacterium]
MLGFKGEGSKFYSIFIFFRKDYIVRAVAIIFVLLLGSQRLFSKEFSGKTFPGLKAGSNIYFDKTFLWNSDGEDEKGEFEREFYKIEVGVVDRFIRRSEILEEKGHSGFGLFVEPYFTKYISMKFQLNHWRIHYSESIERLESLRGYKTSFWRLNILLKINAYVLGQMVYLQAGCVSGAKFLDDHVKRYDGLIKYGGINLGLGVKLFSHDKVSVYLSLEGNSTGRYSLVDSDEWDSNQEICLYIACNVKKKRSD